MTDMQREILKEVAWELEDLNGLLESKKVPRETAQLGAEYHALQILRLAERYLKLEV